MSHSHRRRKRKNNKDINFDEFKVDQSQFEDVEEEEIATQESDCCDKCLFASIGFILLYVGIFVIFFTERDHKYSQQDISFINSNIKSIDLLKNPSFTDTNNLINEVSSSNYPFHFIDKISNYNEKNMIVIDDRTDVSFPGLALKINTEMYQWVETQIQQKIEGKTSTEIIYSYNKKWENIFHDSSNFKEQDDHYNPQPTVSKLSVRNVWVDDIIIGKNENIQFHLTQPLYDKLSKRELWKNVTKKVFEFSELENWEIRDGYCFRPYDKAESYYAEPELDDEPEPEPEPEPEQPATDNNQTETETETDNQTEKEQEEEEEEEEQERIRLDTPRTMIGDIRMAIFSLDPRGETISYLGGLKINDDEDKHNMLIPWKSATNHDFALLEYGEISSNEALQKFGSENYLKLWISRLLSYLFMFCGFLILPNLIYTLSLRIKLPFKTDNYGIDGWIKYIIAACVLSIVLWIIVVFIAYIIGMVYIALIFIIAIVIGLFLNNKPKKEDDDDKKDR